MFDIEKVMNGLQEKKILEKKPNEVKKLTGGTESILFLVDQQFVVKANPERIKLEAEFFTYYKDIELFPNILYLDPAYQFMVYTFLSGSTEYKKGSKQQLLTTLVKKVINHYQPQSETKQWGWVDEPSPTGTDFFIQKVRDSRNIINLHLTEEDHQLASTLAEDHVEYIEQPYLLHGDCGVHNFIMNEGQLCGVIDPIPVLGHPLYDLIYAYCSSPDELTKKTIYTTAAKLMIGEMFTTEYLNKQVVLGLYSRIATCLIHHPHDLETYLKAWEYWINIMKR